MWYNQWLHFSSQNTICILPAARTVLSSASEPIIHTKKAEGRPSTENKVGIHGRAAVIILDYKDWLNLNKEIKFSF
jgi:hypothetical protein